LNIFWRPFPLFLVLVLLSLACRDSSPPSSPTAEDAVPAGTALPKSLLQIASGRPAQSPWVQDRIDTLGILYNISPDGLAALHALEVNQTVGKPGAFGSYGFFNFTIVGESKPVQVMHELGHSYWGAFPIDGASHLSWEPSGGGLPTAMARYHADVLDFMAQPPDQYEPLRERFRVLPSLSMGNTEPLFHTVEADMVYTTAGDLDLVPPILRKYWRQFLAPGPFNSWLDALAWYQSLSTNDRNLANRYLGFEHFDLTNYRTLPAPASARVDPLVSTALRTEDRQRLLDFAGQWDLLLLPAEDKPDFQFWRGYMNDKLDLHRSHPALLTASPLPNAAPLAATLDFLTGLSGQSAQDKARAVHARLVYDPYLPPLLPALDNATLLALYQSGVDISSNTMLGGMEEFLQRLQALTPVVNGVIESGRVSPAEGAKKLTAYLTSLDLAGRRQELNLFFDLLRAADRRVASDVISSLDNALLQRLIEYVPVPLRFSLTPQRTLSALEITPDVSNSIASRGIALLIRYHSGNYRIDEPFHDELYRIVSARAAKDPNAALQLLASTPFPWERFILRYPTEAARILSADLDYAVRIVKASDPIVLPPQRFVYRLIAADPHLAARILQRLDNLGNREIVLESLAYFAYDAQRKAQLPALNISLESNGRFLAALLETLGQPWLQARLSETFSLYHSRVASNESPPDFLQACRHTLASALSTLPAGSPRDSLEALIIVL